MTGVTTLDNTINTATPSKAQVAHKLQTQIAQLTKELAELRREESTRNTATNLDISNILDLTIHNYSSLQEYCDKVNIAESSVNTSRLNFEQIEHINCELQSLCPSKFFITVIRSSFYTGMTLREARSNIKSILKMFKAISLLIGDEDLKILKLFEQEQELRIEAEKFRDLYCEQLIALADVPATTEEKVFYVCELLADGKSSKDACKTVGLSLSTFNTFKRKNGELFELIELKANQQKCKVSYF